MDLAFQKAELGLQGSISSLEPHLKQLDGKSNKDDEIDPFQGAKKGFRKEHFLPEGAGFPRVPNPFWTEDFYFIGVNKCHIYDPAQVDNCQHEAEQQHDKGKHLTL